MTDQYRPYIEVTISMAFIGDAFVPDASREEMGDMTLRIEVDIDEQSDYEYGMLTAQADGMARAVVNSMLDFIPYVNEPDAVISDSERISEYIDQYVRE